MQFLKALFALVVADGPFRLAVIAGFDAERAAWRANAGAGILRAGRRGRPGAGLGVLVPERVGHGRGYGE